MLKSLQDFDWRKSKAHLLFLSKFLHARTAQESAKADSWMDVLRETPQQAIKRFVEEGILVIPGLSEYLAYQYKVSELQTMLKQRGLPGSGRKQDLISRLIAADPEGMKKPATGLSVFQCSDRGQEIANQYLASEKEEREATEREVLVVLHKRKFREASLLVSSYEAAQVFPRGVGIDWENYDTGRDVAVLEVIFSSSPNLLARLEKGKLEPLRLAAGMSYLWGTYKTEACLPAGFETGLVMDCDTVARLLKSHALHQVIMEEYRNGGFVKSVEIHTCNDDIVCDACRELAGKIYTLSEVPELPYEKCTSERGCRCWTGAPWVAEDWKV